MINVLYVTICDDTNYIYFARCRMYLALSIFTWLTYGSVAAETWHVHNGTEYYVSDDTKKFDDARSSCIDLQAELVMIHKRGIQSFLEDLMRSNYISGDLFAYFHHAFSYNMSNYFNNIRFRAKQSVQFKNT